MSIPQTWAFKIWIGFEGNGVLSGLGSAFRTDPDFSGELGYQKRDILSFTSWVVMEISKFVHKIKILLENKVLFYSNLSGHSVYLILSKAAQQ